MDAAEVQKLTDVERRHWWYAERRRILRRLIAGTPAGSRAIDIGAAGGGNTEVLRAAGLHAVAVEYGEAGAVVARSRALPVVRADACRLPFASDALDVVVAFDVLEHLDDDAGAAAEIARVLRARGRLYVAVPADPELWSAHDEAVDHRRRYTKGALVDLLTRAGLAIDDVWSWNVLMRPVVKARRRTSTGSDLDDPSRPANVALRAVVALERVLPVRRLPGVTLMVTAHLPPAE